MHTHRERERGGRVKERQCIDTKADRHSDRKRKKYKNDR